MCSKPDSSIELAMSALDLNALTIGFARCFATYKRAGGWCSRMWNA